MMEEVNIDCPNCHIKIHVPFWRELEVKALEEADLAEISAREELSHLRGWLANVNLWGFLRYRWERRIRRIR